MTHPLRLATGLAEATDQFLIAASDAWSLEEGDPLWTWLNALLYEKSSFKVTRIEHLKNGTVICDAMAYLEVMYRKLIATRGQTTTTQVVPLGPGLSALNGALAILKNRAECWAIELGVQPTVCQPSLLDNVPFAAKQVGRGDYGTLFVVLSYMRSCFQMLAECSGSAATPASAEAAEGTEQGGGNVGTNSSPRNSSSSSARSPQHISSRSHSSSQSSSHTDHSAPAVWHQSQQAGASLASSTHMHTRVHLHSGGTARAGGGGGGGFLSPTSPAAGGGGHFFASSDCPTEYRAQRDSVAFGVRSGLGCSPRPVRASDAARLLWEQVQHEQAQQQQQQQQQQQHQ